MFLERQRVALDFVPEPVRGRIVVFGQRYRKEILRYLPSLYYTPPDLFVSNLDQVISLAKKRGARRICLVTVILPPLKFWHGTPHMERYFAEFNLRVMTTALKHDIPYLDFDRHIWANLHHNPLNADGMHLSPLGHRLLADELAKILA